MSREELLKTTVEKLNQLSYNRLEEVSDYVNFLTAKIDDIIISDGIKSLASGSKTYEFLYDEEDIYQLSDVKENYQ